MNDINSITLIGRLAQDPALAYTQGGTARLNITLAVTRGSKQGNQWVDKASFIDVTVWGKTAENISKYAVKGKQLAITGFIEQQKWQKDGKNYSKLVIIAENVQLLGGKDNAQANNTPTMYSTPELSGDEFPEEIPF